MTCWPAWSRRAAIVAAAARRRRRRSHSSGATGAMQRSWGAGALVAIILIVVAGWSAWVTRRVLREAESTRLMANADRLEDIDYGASLLVNVEAARVAPTLDSSSGLLRRLRQPHFQLAHNGMVSSVAFSPDGKRLA